MSLKYVTSVAVPALGDASAASIAGTGTTSLASWAALSNAVSPTHMRINKVTIAYVGGVTPATADNFVTVGRVGVLDSSGDGVAPVTDGNYGFGWYPLASVATLNLAFINAMGNGAFSADRLIAYVELELGSLS